MTKHSDTTVSDLLADAKPTLIEFYRARCAKCVESLTTLNAVRDKMAQRANVIAVEESSHQDLAKAYGADTYPAFVLFKDGQVVWRDYGVKPAAELEDMISRFI